MLTPHPIRVCMLAEGLPPAFGGAAIQALSLAKQLRSRNVAVFFLSIQSAPDVPATDTVDGFPVYRVPHAVSGKWTKLRKLYRYCFLLWQHREQFDLLHIHGPYYLSLVVGRFAQIVLRKPLLVKLTSMDFDIPSTVQNGPYGWLVWPCYRRADAFICMTTRLRECCRSSGLPEQKLHLLPNGVDTQRFRPPETAAERTQLCLDLGLDPAADYAVFIGAIEENKGIDLLVAMAQRVCAANPQVQFLLIGPDGTDPRDRFIRQEYVAKIRQAIATAGLATRIHLLGRRTNTEQYLRIARVFTFTSRAEGFGTVLIEAMASGLPVVALAIPNVTTDIIAPGKDGIIVWRPDPAEFAAEVEKLLNNPVEAAQLGVNARAKVVCRFDFAIIARRYRQLYEQLLSAR